MKIAFFVPGVPRPGGSKNAFRNPHTGKIQVVESGKHTKEWRSNVRHFGYCAYQDGEPLEGPLRLSVLFTAVRPKCHYGSGRNADVLKDSAPAYPTTRPDITKLLRAVEDALTGVLWLDDSQIVIQRAAKTYRERPGVMINVETIENNQEGGA